VKKEKLSKLIYRNFMATALLPIFFIEIALVVMYFSTNSYVSDKVSDTFVGHSKETISSVVDREVLVLNNQLLEIEKYVVQMQNEHQLFFRDMSRYKPKDTDATFAFAENGAYYKTNNNGGSAAYYSADTKIGEKERNKALYSESFDATFKFLVENNSLVAQAYINTFDNMNRIYPFIENAPAQYGPVVKVADYNFYYEADLLHNPDRKPVWTSAYLDPAGMGWLMSCIVPIYNGDFLEGVTGVDITVERLINNVLNMKLPNESKSFMVDANGMILAMGENVEMLLDLSELKEHAYKDTIYKTIFKPEKYNLYQHPDKGVRQTLAKITGSKKENSRALIKGHEYYVTHRIVDQTGWHLFVLTDMDVLLAPITELKTISFKIGSMAVVVMFLFYLMFFVYFKRRSETLAKTISTPIVNLSEDTKYVGTGFFAYDFEDSEIIEIQQLNINFEEMTTQLERRTQELIRAEVAKLEKEQEAEKLLMISMTDPLTQLYNRMKIDEILDYELEQANRYGKQLSVVMTDIDHFKRINDNYGHHVGDTVLKDFAAILRENTRSSDTVARWGGEEFLIVFTNTALDEAYDIAEKLRSMISTYDFEVGETMTASFGVAQYENGESKEAMINRADEAMYEAKETSRNLVVKK